MNQAGALDLVVAARDVTDAIGDEARAFKLGVLEEVLARVAPRTEPVRYTEPSIATAIAPVRDWYDGDGKVSVTDLDIVAAAVADLVEDRAELLAAREALGRYERERLLTQEGVKVLTCVYCAHEYPPGTSPANHELLFQHVRECPKHPMASLLAAARAVLKAFHLVVEAARVLPVIVRGEEMHALLELERQVGPAPAPPIARPLDEWHEDQGDVLWWRFPIDEAPYVGSPLDSDWPGYHTHWTPLPAVPVPAEGGDAEHND